MCVESGAADNDRSGPTISVVSPVYGCRGSLEKLASRVAEACQTFASDFELILVDDCGPDDAWEMMQELVARHPWVRGVRHSRNFGQHNAISTGIARASGEWTVVLDCDLQDPPEAIPDLYREAVATGAYAVFAQRKNRQDGAAKRFTSWAFHRTLEWLTGAEQDESTANFGIYHRKVIDAVVAMPERERAFPLMVTWTGFTSGVLPVQHAKREVGKSGYTLARMLSLATRAVLGYSEKPLRMVASGGVVCALIAFGFVGLALYQFFSGEITVAGYVSVIASVWLLSGLILFSIGVVGLYVGQVFKNVQGRPFSVVADEIGEPMATRVDPESQLSGNG
jgi:dolichol-phosphate mannosyltransferase